MDRFYKNPLYVQFFKLFGVFGSTVFLLFTFLAFEANSQTFYSRQNGNWNDPNTWSNTGHTGAAATGIPGSTGTPELENVSIGNNNIVTLTQSTTVYGKGLTIDAGATLDAAGFDLNLYFLGTLDVQGSLINAATVTTYNSVNIKAPNVLFKDIVVESNYQTFGGGGGSLTLLADINTYGVTVNPAGDPATFGNNSFNKNGFNVNIYDGNTYFSKQSGNWNSPSTWSPVNHTGPGSTDVPTGGTGQNVEIGSGHIVTATGPIGIGGGSLTLQSGSTLDAANNAFNIFGTFTINGTLKNPGLLTITGTISSNGKMPVFSSITYGGAFPGADLSLDTDIVVLNTIQGANGTSVLNTNGFIIYPCIPPTVTASSQDLNFTIKSTGMDFTWTRGDGAKLLIVVNKTTDPQTKPQFGTTYNANTVFGAGDQTGAGSYVVYNGTGTSASITGLTGSTQYQFGFFEYNTSGQCYLIDNYQNLFETTCIPAPANPVNASYCQNDIKPAINVDSPGSGRTIIWYDAANGGNVVGGDTSGGDGRGGVFIPSAASGTFYAETNDPFSPCSNATRTAVTLTLNPLPAANSQTPSVCETSSGKASNIDLTSYESAITAGAANTKVMWFSDNTYKNPVSTPTSVSVQNNDIFYAEVENTSTLCTAKTKVTFTVTALPKATLSGSKEVCPNAKGVQYTGGAAGTYTWEVPVGATIASGQGTNTVTVNYGINGGTLKVTPSASGGCAGVADQATITVDPVATAFDVTGGGLYCTGTAGVAIGLSGAQTGISYEVYQNNAATGNKASGKQASFDFATLFTKPGTYVVKASTASGCSTDMNGNAVVTQSSVPSGTGTINGVAIICKGQQATFTVTGISQATEYEWSVPTGLINDSQTDAQVVIKTGDGNGGTLSVTGKNDCGKGGSATLNVSVQALPDVAINLPYSSIIISDAASFSFTSSATLKTYTWDFGDGGNSFSDAPQHTYSSPGDYVVKLNIEDVAGCINSDQKTLTILAEPGLTEGSIKNTVTANGDGKNDLLYIDRIEKFPDNEVVLLDRWGVEVFRVKGYDNTWDFKKNGEYLPVGNYICIVKSNENNTVATRTVTVIK